MRAHALSLSLTHTQTHKHTHTHTHTHTYTHTHTTKNFIILRETGQRGHDTVTLTWANQTALHCQGRVVVKVMVGSSPALLPQLCPKHDIAVSSVTVGRAQVQFSTNQVTQNPKCELLICCKMVRSVVFMQG